MKGQCEFCGKELLDKANIRCDNCDRIWNDGVEFGKIQAEGTMAESLNVIFSVYKKWLNRGLNETEDDC
jgi:hypothetical protein